MKPNTTFVEEVKATTLQYGDPTGRPFFPIQVLTFLYDVKTESIRACDHSGFMLTREDWKELREAINRFFKHGPSECEILEHNYALCRKYEAKPPRQIAKAKPLYPGFIYLLKSGEGLYKIGKTKHLDKRIANFGLTLPFLVELAASYQVPDMKSAELHWHGLFAEKRVNGEWFRLDEGDVQAFITTAQEQAV